MTLKRRPLKGFTLPELLVVLSLVTILAAVFFLQLPPMINMTNDAVDVATLKTLNSATGLFKVLKGSTESEDVFYGYSTDSERLAALLQEGYIDKVPVPRTDSYFYSWDISNQKWVLISSFSPQPVPNIHIVTASEIEFGTDYWASSIIKYTASHQEIIIPSIIDGMPVIAVYQDVFNGAGLTSVVFEEGLSRLHARAFKDNEITEIVLPNSLTRLDYGVFMGNPLTKVTIGPNVAIIEGGVFQNNDSFISAYTVNGQGTYVYTDGSWLKQ